MTAANPFAAVAFARTVTFLFAIDTDSIAALFIAAATDATTPRIGSATGGSAAIAWAITTGVSAACLIITATRVAAGDTGITAAGLSAGITRTVATLIATAGLAGLATGIPACRLVDAAGPGRLARTILTAFLAVGAAQIITCPLIRTTGAIIETGSVTTAVRAACLTLWAACAVVACLLDRAAVILIEAGIPLGTAGIVARAKTLGRAALSGIVAVVLTADAIATE